MTKGFTGAVAFALCAALLLFPFAAAHGAPGARSIDARVVQDNTSAGDYGALPPPLTASALDLLSLDAREAHGPDGRPGLFLRLTTHTDDPEGDHNIDITFKLGGTEHTFDVATQDHLTWTSSTFDWVSESIPVGDGHPQAVDLFVAYEKLGAEVGDELTDVVAVSHAGDAAGDWMPGGYSTAVAQITPLEDDGTTAMYALAGPAPLVAIEADTETLDLRNASGEKTVTFTVTSGTTDLEQFVQLALARPSGLSVALSEATLVLAGGESATVTATLSPGDAVLPGDLRLTATTDLGGRASATVPIIGAVATDDRAVATDDLGPGASYQQLFTTIGTFDYHCHPHPWMQAKVTVTAAPNGTEPAIHQIAIVEPDGSDPTTWHFAPEVLEVHSGDIVVWLNQGNEIHTIMGGFGGSGGHSDDGHDHGDHDHGDDDTEDAPGFTVFAIVAGLGAAAVLTRRRL